MQLCPSKLTLIYRKVLGPGHIKGIKSRKKNLIWQDPHVSNAIYIYNDQYTIHNIYTDLYS